MNGTYNAESGSAKRGILVVSFGTSYAETRAKTIEAIEKKIQERFPEYEVRRAFTSPTIMRVLKNRDGILVDNPAEALARMQADGFTEVVVQTTHVINGFEYHDLLKTCHSWRGRFERMAIGAPLMSTREDCEAVVSAVMAAVPELKADEALLLMGHGTEHPSFTLYPALDYMFKQAGHRNVYVGTVDGYPELEDAMALMKPFEYKRVHLMPLMVVAGDHAQNDMAGDEDDSWKNVLEGAGYPATVHMQGLGELEAIRDLYCSHVEAAIASLTEPTEEK